MTDHDFRDKKLRLSIDSTLKTESTTVTCKLNFEKTILLLTSYTVHLLDFVHFETAWKIVILLVDVDLESLFKITVCYYLIQ